MKIRYKLNNTNGNWEESYPNTKYKKQGDCVVRAISIATEQSYKKVLSDLCTKAIEVWCYAKWRRSICTLLERF